MKKAVLIVNGILKGITEGLIAVLTLIIIVNVITRYIFKFSLNWSAEAVTYCMIWAAFIGAAILVNRGEHIVAINAFEKLFKNSKMRLIFRMILSAVSIFFYIALTYCGIQMVIQTRGQVAASIRFLPINVVYLIIPISGLLMIFGEAVRIYNFYHEWNKDEEVAK